MSAAALRKKLDVIAKPSSTIRCIHESKESIIIYLDIFYIAIQLKSS